MAVEFVCLFNKFGHCKYQDRCRKIHIGSICERNQCEIAKCQERHPGECNFYKEFGRCKFGEYCSFQHKPSVVETCKTLQKEIDDVKAKLEALENEMKRKDDEAILINIEKKEKQTDEENAKANETENTEETHKADIENLSNTFIESKLETYCQECDIIFRLGELLIYRNHCAVQHGWFP